MFVGMIIGAHNKKAKDRRRRVQNIEDMKEALISAANASGGRSRLGEPIAAVAPARIEDVVRGVAMSNQAAATAPPEPKSSRALRWVCAFIFFLAIFVFVTR